MWVQKDLKVPVLKKLQGTIWKEGYAIGELKGQMFADVSTAFAQWADKGKRIYIFSSGSRQAQLSIFQNSEFGDLSTYISGYFEPSSVGGTTKQDKASYAQIALSIGKAPQDILFATDVIGEARAACEAGFKTAILMRRGI